MKKVISGLCVLMGTLFAGCQSVQTLGKVDGDDQVIFNSADKRAVFVTTQPVKDFRRFTSTGKPGDPIAAASAGSRRVICAEPSPDVAKAISEALQLQLKATDGKNEVGAGVSKSVTESIAQLGQRIATIQLLRDELADLCRAYSNGAVTNITYTLRLSRLDRKMITLLISEAGAGALTRGLIALTGSAQVEGGSVGQETLKRADERVKAKATQLADETKATQNLEGQLKDKNAAIEKAKADQADTASLQTELDQLTAQHEASQKKVASSQQELADLVSAKGALEIAASGGVKSNGQALAVATLLNGGKDGDTQAHNSSPVDLLKIHRNYMDDVDVGVLLDACFTTMEDSSREPVSDEGSTQRRNRLAAISHELNTLRPQISELLAKLQASEEEFMASNPNPSQVARSKFRATQIRSEDRIKFEQVSAQEKRLMEEAATLKQDLETGSQPVANTLLATWCNREGMAQIINAVNQQVNANLLKRLIAQESSMETKNILPVLALQTCAQLNSGSSNFPSDRATNSFEPNAIRSRFELQYCVADLMSALTTPNGHETNPTGAGRPAVTERTPAPPQGTERAGSATAKVQKSKAKPQPEASQK